MKRTLFLLLVLMLSACAAQPAQESTPAKNAPYVLVQEENPYEPKTEDVKLKQDGVTITSASLSERYDLNPLRAELHIFGSMPSVCNEMRIKVNPPDNEYRIVVEIYSVADPKLKCENVFQQIETTILLGEYSAGQYTVWVNDSLVGSVASY